MLFSCACRSNCINMPRRLMKLLTHQTTNGSHLQSALWLFEAGCFPPEADGACPPNALARLGCCSFGSPWAPRARTSASGEQGKEEGAAEQGCLCSEQLQKTPDCIISQILSVLQIRQKSQWPGLGTSELHPSRVQASSIRFSSEPLSAPDLLRGGW